MKTWRKDFSIILFFLAVFSVSYGTPVTADASYSASCEAQAENLKDDCAALEALYDATGGGQWSKKTNWKTTKPLYQWQGVSTNSSGVTMLLLNSAGLNGTLPDLSALTELTRLYLNHNYNLSGTVPDLSALTKLERVHFQSTDLGGTISDLGLSSLASLKRLDISATELSGTIPDLSSLTSLTNLILHANKLSGTIPDLDKLVNLTELRLNRNKLSGGIPNLDKLVNLTFLSLSWNDNLGGGIPDLSKPVELGELHLSQTGLSGTIPALSALVKLRILDLGQNDLGGGIPDLDDLEELVSLNLAWNNLSGEIPDLDKLTKLKSLRLHDNNLGGEIPALTGLTELKALELFSNNLSGEIPSSLSNLTKMWHLKLHENNLGGEIPALSNLTELYTLFLSDNNLSGEVPDLSGLTSLRQIRLQNNRLSGELPDLSALNGLGDLHAYNNRISGTLDGSKLPSSGDLWEVYLHDNKLTGSGGEISPDLSGLSGLKELSLWGNTDPVGTIDFATGVNMSVVDLAALRFLFYANGGYEWNNKANWLWTWLPLGRWYGVTTDSDGRVTGLDLSGNGLKNDVSNSIEAFSALTSLNFFHNQQLGGTLPVRLKDIPNLRSVDIRCTGVSTPYSISFNSWVERLGSGFKSGCGATPSQELKEESEPEPEVVEKVEPETEVLEEPESGPEVVREPESVSGVYSDWDCGGCAIVPAAETAAARGNTAFNLLLVMLALFAVSLGGRFRSD